MCIAIYKPMGIEFPSKRTLKECFENNPDGAGFMVATGEAVRYEKGFMYFKEFWRALKSAREKFGDDKAYVLHFRISTQAGVNKECTHPFPLSKNMSELRTLKGECNIGVAHNGIISLTTSYKKGISHSDTMEFITDYLAYLIHNEDYYYNKDTLDVITRLADSRLAILDRHGHCETLGQGWLVDRGVYYSNTSYKEDPYRHYKPIKYAYESDAWLTEPSTTYDKALEDDAENDLDKETKFYEALWDYYDYTTDSFDFNETECPLMMYGDDSWCEYCKSNIKCFE